MTRYPLSIGARRDISSCIRSAISVMIFYFGPLFILCGLTLHLVFSTLFGSHSSMISSLGAILIVFFISRQVLKSRAVGTTSNDKLSPFSQDSESSVPEKIQEDFHRPIPQETMAPTMFGANKVRILVINPNSNKDMTHGLDELVSTLSFSSDLTDIATYTAPSGPNSINNEDDAHETALIILKDFAENPSLNDYDAYVVACYSQHPLVPALRKRQRTAEGSMKPVVGIFEASISLSLNIVNSCGLVFGAGSKMESVPSKFGIVTTGMAWIPLLTMGVNAYLGAGYSEDKSMSATFKGVESTGLNADELHTAPEDEVRQRMVDATTRQVKDKDVCVVILGCAGMAGMDKIVREACIKELGEEDGNKVVIVDGVKAAIAMTDGQLRSM